ncbi:MAG: hypothetical protein MZW92_71855 [Comamonadaceae bacterium]|nr:hypothetical protein [Comamonadaceae bacterium]
MEETKQGILRNKDMNSENGGNGMKKWIQKHPLMAYIMVSFGFSWGLWALMILSSHGMLPFRFPTHWIGSFGPMVGAIATLAFTGGKGSIKALFRSMIDWKIGWGWFIFCIFASVMLSAVELVLYMLIGNPMPEMTMLSGFQCHRDTPILRNYPLHWGAIWRGTGVEGVLQPILHQKMTPFVSTILIGLIWAAWHYPLIYLEGRPRREHPLFHLDSPLSQELFCLRVSISERGGVYSQRCYFIHR